MRIVLIAYLFLSLFLVVPNMCSQEHSAAALSDSAKAVKGKYLGEATPGTIAKLFARGVISSTDYEHGSPTFSPDGEEVYWSVRLRDIVGREVIRFMKNKNGQWTSPRTAPFSDTTQGDLYPTFSPNGRTMYFTSDRPLVRNGQPTNRNIWKMERRGDRWSEPQPVGFDSLDAYGISLTSDGTLYFMAQRSDKSGSHDIYRSRFNGDAYLKPERLADPISTRFYEDCPFIAPDERYLIFESDRPGGLGGLDLYISYRRVDGSWADPKNLGSAINSASSERFAAVSPEGRYLFFGSNRNGNYDVYWIDAAAIGGLIK